MEENYRERIGKLDDMHSYLLDNEFIVKGYRLNFNSTKKIFRSLFLVHNETVNIWTHFLGFLLFFQVFLYFVFTTDFSSDSEVYIEYVQLIQSEFMASKAQIEEILSSVARDLVNASMAIEKNYEEVVGAVFSILDSHEQLYDLPVQQVSRWPLLVYILSALACLLCSTMFHLFNAHSHQVKSYMNSLDYAGIAILICGSFFPPIYYMFFCDSSFIWLYLSTISLSSAVVFGVTLSSDFQKPHCRWFRGVIFLMLGLFGVVPIGHITFL
jgi:adiponectin receptor